MKRRPLREQRSGWGRGYPRLDEMLREIVDLETVAGRAMHVRLALACGHVVYRAGRMTEGTLRQWRRFIAGRRRSRPRTRCWHCRDEAATVAQAEDTCEDGGEEPR